VTEVLHKVLKSNVSYGVPEWDAVVVYPARGENMNIKRGNVVSHSGAIAWGTGKVVEVTPLKATILFSDGVIRKIASSHFTILQPADPATFIAIPDNGPVEKVRAVPKRLKKEKQPVV
jgi:hypothetical protein